MSELTSDPQGAGQPLLSSSATATHRVGERLVVSDGRVFRYAKAGALLVTGNWLQAPAQIADHQGLTPANTAIGARTLSVTLGATAATANQYAGGWAIVTVTPGLGQIFGISGHPAAAGAAALVLTLTDEVRVALTAAASKIDLIPNPYNAVIQTPITTLTGPVAGVAIYPIASGEYGWIQRSGPAAALIAGTPAVGAAVVVPGTAAGAAVIDGAATATYVVGSMMETGGDGETNAVMVALE